jgi:dihydrofolate reductase
MPDVTCDISISLDGYAAGPNQRRDAPFGDGVGEDGKRLHAWMFDRPDENAAEIEGITGAGAYIMGRNMFGPDRGDWDLDWKGWWGDDPPYHGPVFVLAHRPREPLEMEGGTTFTFVNDGIESALAQAREAAGDGRVAIAGGPTTVNEFLAAGLIDELRLHVVPAIVGAGERLFDTVADVDLELVSQRSNDLVTHLTYRIPR